MKTSRILYLATALAAGLLVSCKEEVFEPGPEVSGAQVYFPNDVATEYSIGDDVASVTIPVMRISTEGATSVDILADLKDIEDADQSLFTIPAKADFQDGKDKAEFVISFDRAKLVDGKEYKIGLLIMDEENTTPYGNRTLYISISPWPWELIGTGKYRDDWFCAMWNGGNVERDVNIHKHKSKEGTYMVEDMFGWGFLTEFFGGTQEEIEGAGYVTYTPTNITIDCTDPDKVLIPEQFTGVTDLDPSYGDYSILTAEYGTFKEGVITFPVQGLGLKCAQGSMYANKNGLFRIVMPGTEIVDYSLSVAYGGMKVGADNETALAVLDFTYGADVTGVGYVFVDGDASADVAEIASRIAAGTEENVYEIEDFVAGSEKASIEAELSAAGEYTVVALPKDKNNAYSADEAASAVFYFPGLGGGVTPCDVNLNLYKVSEYEAAAEYVDQCPDYSSMVYEIYGSELKSLKYYLNSTAVVESAASQGVTPEDLVTLYGKDFAQGDVDVVNSGEKLWDIFINLDSETSYTMIVSASNTYGKKAVVSKQFVTASVPYSGELKVGRYTMTYETETEDGKPVTCTNTFTLKPTVDGDTKFVVNNLGIDDCGMSWHAEYDKEASTLTLSGLLVNNEDKGNAFAKWWALDETTAISFYSFTDPEGNADLPLVFSVDNSSKQLSALTTNLEVALAEINGSQVGNIIGANVFYADGTAIAYGGTASSAASMSAEPVYANLAGNLSPAAGRQVFRLQSAPQRMHLNNFKSGDAGVSTLKVVSRRCEPLPKETARVGVNTEFPFNALAR